MKDAKSSLSFCLGVGYLIISIAMNLPFFANTVYLAMDRTNWEIGKFNINPLLKYFLNILRLTDLIMAM
jgi:hypothetical protein